MDKIDKIRQEIERRKVQYYEREMKAWDDNGEYGDEDCYFYQGKRNACEGLLCFIDTLSEEPDKSLEEAAKTFCDTLEGKESWSYGPDHYDWGDANNAFIAGARWQKEQMLKDAVEGEVCATITGTNAISFLSPLPKELTAGDKVRIIIVKEDGK